MDDLLLNEDEYNNNEFYAPEDQPIYQSLQRAAKEGDQDLLYTVLNSNIRLDAQFETDSHQWQTAMHIAAYHGYTDIVRLLLKHGVDVNILDVNAMTSCTTPIWYAASGVATETVELLLDAGARTNVVGSCGSHVLSEVVHQPVTGVREHYSNEAIIRTLSLFLDRGVPVNLKSGPLQTTALATAVQYNNQDVIRFLLSRGASLDGALFMVAHSHRDEPSLLRLLLDAGARDSDGRALVEAVHNGRTDIVRVILTNEPKQQLLLSDHHDPVGRAASKGYVEILQMLVDHGYPVNRKDWKGSTALHRAMGSGSPEVVRILLAAGASVNDCNQHGYTPLHFIAIEDPELALETQKKMLQLLLAGGADKDVQNQRGKVPQELATNEEIKAMLNPY